MEIEGGGGGAFAGGAIAGSGMGDIPAFEAVNTLFKEKNLPVSVFLSLHH